MCSLRESKLKRAKRGILLPWEQFNKNRHSIAGIRKSHLFTCNCYSLLIKSQRCFNTVSVPKRVAVQTKSCVQTDQEQFKVRMQQTAIGSFNNALLMTRLIVLSSVCALACRAKTHHLYLQACYLFLKGSCIAKQKHSTYFQYHAYA